MAEALFFCLGLFLAAAFCMKWMEPDLLQGGKLFTVIGLEVSYPAEKLRSILSGLDDHTRAVLRYHLSFDFIFMAGVYPGIAALCMMGRFKATSLKVKTLLSALAILQLVAWGCDITENSFLLKWIKTPDQINGFGAYHIVVWTKWILALFGALLAIPFAIKRYQRVLKT